MNKLEQIEVVVSHNSPSQVAAILNEIDELLKQLIEQNKPSAIDLRSLPLFPGDYENLRELLGEGEITAKLNSLGPSSIVETRIPGVWWCTHYNEADEKIAEFIEITRIPELLLTDSVELQQSRSKLAELINLPQEGEYDAPR
ncbi:MAG: hydrogenase expression/formation C-terminal domain-containing protein [Thioalkalispiraceae bacterium]|jgi:hydrogenase-1 operon protein HyaF